MQDIHAKPLSVLFVDPAPFMGGAQTSLLTLMQELVVRGHRITLACASPELHRLACQAQIPCRQFSARHWPATLRGLGQLLQDRMRLNAFFHRLFQDARPDLIHLNTLRAGLLVPKLPCPTVLHDRDLRVPHVLPRLLGKRYPHLIAISHAVADKWSHTPTVCTIIHNPIQRPPNLGGSPLPSQPFNVIQVADLVPWKNHLLFIHAVAELKKQLPALKAVIRGRLRDPSQKPYLDHLRETIRNLSLEQTLSLETRPGDAWHDMQQAHLLVSTALHEPFGRTVIEAMALGKPVVAIESAGMRELLSGCNAATLLPPAPTDTLPCRLAQAIGAWTDRIPNTLLADSARTRAEQFSPQVIAPQIETLYQKLLNSHAHRENVLSETGKQLIP